MDSMPPPPPPLHTSSSCCSAAGAASFVAGPSFSSGSPRGSMSTALLGSQSQLRSSLYPQPLPNRIASRSAAASHACSRSSSSSSSRSRQVPPPSPAAGGSRQSSQTAALYEELCLIRSTSVEFFAHLDAVAEAHRATRTFRRRQPQLLHHQARPSSTMTSSGLPPLPPRGTFSRNNKPSTSHHSQQQTRPSQTTASLPPLPRRGFSGYAPSSSRQGQPARPSSSSATSRQPNLTGGGSIPGYAPWPSSSTSGRLDLMPNGNISGYSPSFPQLQQARPSSTTFRLPQLPGASFSGYAPSSSQQQHQHAWPSSPSVTSAQPDLPNGTVFGKTPSLSPQQHQAESAPGLPPLPGSFSAFAPPSTASHHHQQEPWKATLAGSSADPAQSWSNNTTSGTGFVQPSSSSGQYELPPLPPSLLPVKQEPVDSSDCCLEPELIYIDDDTTDDLDALMASLEEPSTGLERMHLLESSSSGDMQQLQLSSNGDELMMSSRGATDSSGQSWPPMPEEVVNVFGMMSIDASSSSAGGRSMAWNCQGSIPMSQQQVPWQGETLASWSSDQSPHWQPSPQSDTPGFVQPTSPVELPSLPSRLDMVGISTVGDSTSSARDVLQCGGGIGLSAWNAASTGSSDQNSEEMQGAASKMSWQGHSSSMESPGPITMPKLRLGGMESQRVLPRSPSSVAGASSSMSRTGANGNLFTDAEMEKVMKDKRLKELVNTDPKRVKRILNNRASTAKLTAHKKKCVRDLERQFEALQIENLILYSRVRQEQVRFVELNNQNNEMGMRLQQLEVKAKMGEAQTEALRAEIEGLKRVDLSGLYSSGGHNPITHTEYETADIPTVYTSGPDPR